MLKWISVLLVLIAGVLFAWWDMSSTPNGITVAETQEDDTKSAPEFSFTSLDGKEFHINNFKDKTVFVNFWATWCPPCIAEIPDLLDLAAREQDKMVLIALSADMDKSTIEKFLKKLPENAQQKLDLDNIIFGHDEDLKISSGIFGSTLFPETYIIQDGKIVRKVEGVIDWLGEDIKALINKN